MFRTQTALWRGAETAPARSPGEYDSVSALWRGAETAPARSPVEYDSVSATTVGFEPTSTLSLKHLRVDLRAVSFLLLLSPLFLG